MASEDDDALKTLLHWAGRRAAPPQEVQAAVYQHSRRAWSAQVQRRKALRRGIAWAAGVVAIVLAGWGGLTLYPHRVLATVAEGQSVRITRSLWHPLAGRGAGKLYEGDSLQSADTGASLRRA